MKKTLLFVTESSYLSTGYSVYSKEILKRLHDSGLFNVIELGCFGSYDDPRQKTIPWTHISNCPNPRDQNEIKGYNSDEFNKFGQFRFNDLCVKYQPDIVFDPRDFWMCLTENTPLFTNKGIKTIKEIYEDKNHLVLTHKGKLQKIKDLIPVRIHDGTFIKITPRIFRVPITITDKHPVLCIQKNTINACTLIKKKKPKWVNSDELKSGDILCFPRTKIEIKQEFRFKKVTPGIGKLIGFYIACGSFMYKNKQLTGIKFRIPNNRKELKLEIYDLIKSEFNMPVKLLEKNNKEYMCVYSTHISEFISRCIPNNKKSKTFQLKTRIYFESNHVCKNFLYAFIKTRGYLDTGKANRVALVMYSKRFAMQIFEMCVRFNILPSLSFQKGKGYGKGNRYILSFRSKDALNGYKALMSGEEIVGSKYLDKNYAYFTIDKIEKYQDKKPVYNIEVEEDNSYVSSFALHNCEFQERSPFREYFHWSLMPTCDAYPQHEQWLSTYINTDSLFAYTDWGIDLLKKQTENKINAIAVTSPGVDFNIFYPQDKEKNKNEMGFDGKLIVGTVMRNQERKLYPNLIQDFAHFLKQAPEQIANKTYLYLHTSWPDKRGWDIPRLIKENKVSHKVIMTYVCKKCEAVFPNHFMDVKGHCKKCGEYHAQLVSNHNGISREVLSKIYNLFDVYVQYAAFEGLGIPVAEAAACGIPTMAVNYSGMCDFVNKIKTIPINVNCFIKELETHRDQAVPDRQDFINKLIEILRMPSSMRKSLGKESRHLTQINFNYDKSAKILIDYFNTIPKSTKWNSPAKIHEPNLDIPQFPNNAKFVNWAFTNIAGRPDLANSYMAMRMTRDLDWQFSLPNAGGFYWNEASTLGLSNDRQDFNHEIVIGSMVKLAEEKNFWEKKRVENA